MKNIPYHTDSGSYLSRAEECLKKELPQYLFYCAMEMRCFLEARQSEYLEFQKQYRASLPPSWRTGLQRKELQQIFSAEKIQVSQFCFEDGFSFNARFVPISSSLSKSIGRLNRFRHALPEALTHPAALDLEEELTKIVPAAQECQSGNMVCPLIKSGDDKPLVNPVIRFDEHAEQFRERLQDGVRVTIKVEYEDFKYS